ncbi:hypothetical protein GH733_000915 [Mirounga leonina]|nr:hypothetical protein GH733_000915 [Mirounga leonina]
MVTTLTLEKGKAHKPKAPWLNGPTHTLASGCEHCHSGPHKWGNREGSLAQRTIQDLTKCEKEIWEDSFQCPIYFNFKEVVLIKKEEEEEEMKEKNKNKEEEGGENRTPVQKTTHASLITCLNCQINLIQILRANLALSTIAHHHRSVLIPISQIQITETLSGPQTKPDSSFSCDDSLSRHLPPRTFKLKIESAEDEQ